MNRCIASVAMGERYTPLIGRFLSSFSTAQDTSPVKAWVNAFPENVPSEVKKQPHPWIAYSIKPFALKFLFESGYEMGLLTDAACYVIKKLDKLWEHIDEHGYYIQDNGWNVGQWCADQALEKLGITREHSFNVPEVSSMVVGLDFRKSECRKLLDEWCNAALAGAFIGPHTNSVNLELAKKTGVAGRTVGFCSNHPLVLGHRHDQTSLSVIAHRFDWKRTPRPIFVDYQTEGVSIQDQRSLILNRGGL